MSKETELSDEQIDNCVGNLGMAENSILVGPEEIRKAMRAVIAADRELRRGDAGMPPLPEPWQGFQFNPGWNTWENVIRGAINEPRVMKAFTAEQMHEYAQAALAAKDVELKGLRPVIVWPSPAAVERKPLTNFVMADQFMMEPHTDDVFAAYQQGIRFAERYYGITAQQGEKT